MAGQWSPSGAFGQPQALGQLGGAGGPRAELGHCLGTEAPEEELGVPCAGTP